VSSLYLFVCFRHHVSLFVTVTVTVVVVVVVVVVVLLESTMNLC